MLWFGPIIDWVFSAQLGETVMSVVIAALLGTLQLPSPDQVGISSRFGTPGDKWVGGTLACQPDRRVQVEDYICAHRTYPCKTLLILENPRTNKRSWCRVMDRGPYGANTYSDGKLVRIDGKRQWYVKKNQDHLPPDEMCPTGDCEGRWRGKLDISPAASYAMDHNGFEKIRVWRVDKLMRFFKHKEEAAKRNRM